MPTAGGSRQNKNKEQKKRSAWPCVKYRNYFRPHDIPGMDHKTKCGRRLLPPTQQHENKNSIRHIKDEQAIRCPGMAQLRRIHLDRHQCRHGEDHASRGQPALGPARLARIRRDSQSPGLSIALNVRIQSSRSPRAGRLRGILLNKRSLRASESLMTNWCQGTVPTQLSFPLLQ